MATPSAIVRKAATPVIRPLGALASLFSRAQASLYQAPGNYIPGIKETDFPSPLQPVAPIGPPDAQPLAFNLQMGQNLIFTPRPDARYAAADLQALARYPLASLCISNVKNTIAALRWKVQLRAEPGEDRKAREARQLKDTTIGQLTQMVGQPNPNMEFPEFARRLIDDMLTIDAGSVLIRKTKEKVVAWEPMQGAYIVRLVDGNGYTPAAPAPAYQQLWDGLPRVNLSTDQLVYRPRNIRYQVGNIASSLYGASPTEELADELEVGIQRLRYVKAFYKDGSIPNVLWVVPANAQPDTVANAMQILNQDLAGNLESRRHFRFAQGFFSSESSGKESDNIHQFEEPKLSDEYDDLHTRRVCFGYGTSPQRLLRMMTRATAQSNQEAAEEEGIAPFRRWMQDFMNVLILKAGYEKYEFIFDTSSDPDPAKQAEIDAADLGASMATINEKRLARGLDPRPEPQANKLGKWLTTGWVEIGAPPAIPGGAAPEPKNSGGGGGQGGNDDHDDDDDHDGGAGAGNGKSDKSAPRTIEGVAADSVPTLNPSRDTIRSRNAKATLSSKIMTFFQAVRSQLTLVSVSGSKKMRKGTADDEDKKRIEQIVETIMSRIPWRSLPDFVQPALLEAAQDGGTMGLDELQRAYQSGPMRVSLSPNPVRVIEQTVISEVNQLAMDYARSRAAELVGMKWVDGELVQNPNAAMAITETTRTMLRDVITDAFAHEANMAELTEKIRNAGAFSDERARLIADTEVKFAQSGGNFGAWQKSGLVVATKWIRSAEHVVEDECDENAAAGAVEIGKPFPSGDFAVPAHPRCQCTQAIATLKKPEKKAP